MAVSQAIYGSTELLQIADAVAREKGLSKDSVLEAMEQAIQVAGRRKYGHEHDIRAEIDKKTGEIKLYRVRTVVETIENELTEITLKDAKKLDASYEFGNQIRDLLPDSGDLGTRGVDLGAGVGHGHLGLVEHRPAGRSVDVHDGRDGVDRALHLLHPCGDRPDAAEPAAHATPDDADDPTGSSDTFLAISSHAALQRSEHSSSVGGPAASSYSVRILILCASMYLPFASNQETRSTISSRMFRMATCIFSLGVTNCFAGKRVRWVSSPRVWPVRGSKRVIRSISSPKNSRRTASSSFWAGKISTTSPRTRNFPRPNSISLRS